jgi:hypothetical protein
MARKPLIDAELAVAAVFEPFVDSRGCLRATSFGKGVFVAREAVFIQRVGGAGAGGLGSKGEITCVIR